MRKIYVGGDWNVFAGQYFDIFKGGTMTDTYILDHHEAVPCDDVLMWAKWYASADRQVAKDEPVPGMYVSTVFLGLDHSFSLIHGGRPLLFETMVFGGPLDQEQVRYSTWEEAERGHVEMVERVCQNSAGVQ